MSTGFVIGNGMSRKSINLTLLQKYGMTYGCNAIYRDFSPDVLVSTDQGISTEIISSRWPVTGKHYTRKIYNNSKSLPLPIETQQMSSGPNALHLAILNKHKHIFLIGIDFGSVNAYFNNIYADTDHYKAGVDEPTYAGNWVYHISRMIEINKSIMFERVVNNHSKKNIFDFPNYKEISVDDFVCNHK